MSRTMRRPATPVRWNWDFGAMLAAATFAEAGEPEIAIEMLRDRREAPGSIPRCDRDRLAAAAPPPYPGGSNA